MHLCVFYEVEAICALYLFNLIVCETGLGVILIITRPSLQELSLLPLRIATARVFSLFLGGTNIDI